MTWIEARPACRSASRSRCRPALVYLSAHAAGGGSFAPVDLERPRGRVRRCRRAVLGGLCELIERDALMISWLNRLPAAELELARERRTCRRRCAGTTRRWASSRARVRAGHRPARHDRAGARAATTARTGRRTIVGLGCHPSPAIALDEGALRALPGASGRGGALPRDPAGGRLKRYEDVRHAGRPQRVRGAARAARRVRVPVARRGDGAARRAGGSLAAATPPRTSTRAPRRSPAPGTRVAYADLTTADVAPTGYHVARVVADRPATDPLRPRHASGSAASGCSRCRSGWGSRRRAPSSTPSTRARTRWPDGAMQLPQLRPDDAVAAVPPQLRAVAQRRGVRGSWAARNAARPRRRAGDRARRRRRRARSPRCSPSAARPAPSRRRSSARRRVGVAGRRAGDRRDRRARRRHVARAARRAVGRRPVPARAARVRPARHRARRRALRLRRPLATASPSAGAATRPGCWPARSTRPRSSRRPTCCWRSSPVSRACSPSTARAAIATSCWRPATPRRTSACGRRSSDLATLCIGGFIDSELNAALGLDDTEAGVVYAVAAGHPA